MAGFGSQTDYFNIPTLITNTDLHFIESSTTPMAISVEQAMDENGNVAAEDSYESGPAAAIECVYDLLAGTLDLDDVYLGFITASNPKVVAVSIGLVTSNGAWPRLTVSGFTGVTNETTMPQFFLPAITVNGLRQAQGLDFTVAAGCRLTGSSLTASGEFHHALDTDGAVAAMAFTGANAEISMDAVEITAAVGWTPGGTWIETQAPGASNSNISWGTASASATKKLAKFVALP